MKVLLFVLLAGYAAKCDENNYYVVEMQEDLRMRPSKPFKVYWNVPTKQCRSKKIPFDSLYDRFGIIQNENDAFRGEKITILYDPGLFPALLKNESSGKFKFRNGGVPQEGDLEKHLKAFEDELDLSIPDKNFQGIGIIDFESWRPVYRQNFGVLRPYKDVSYEIERSRHRLWPSKWIEEEAKRRFEESARLFMAGSLAAARRLRPRALWGYYGFPYCFNVASNNMREGCAPGVPEENDQISWLWRASTLLLPSVYSSAQLPAAQLTALVRGRVREAARFHRHVLPYFWYKYRDAAAFLSEEDLNAVLSTFYKSNATGFIIWGSSNDVNTAQKCNKLKDYVENVLGPAIAKYTKPILRDPTVSNEVTEETTVNNEYSTTTDNRVKVIDPEYHWIPPENYTQDIKDHVAAEINNKLTNYTEADDKNTVLDNNVLIDLILNSIFNSNISSSVENTTKSNVDRDISKVEDANGLLNESFSSTTTQHEAFEAVTDTNTDKQEELESSVSTEGSESFEATSINTQDPSTFSHKIFDDITTEEPIYKNIKKTSIQNRRSMEDINVTETPSTDKIETDSPTQETTETTTGFSDYKTEISKMEDTTKVDELSTSHIESSYKEYKTTTEYTTLDIIITTTNATDYATSNVETTNANIDVNNASTTEFKAFNKSELNSNANTDLNETNEIIKSNNASTAEINVADKTDSETKHREGTEPTELKTDIETDSSKVQEETSLAPPTTTNQVVVYV